MLTEKNKTQHNTLLIPNVIKYIWKDIKRNIQI